MLAPSSGTSGAESAGTADAGGELVDLDEGHLFHSLDHQLSDPFASPDLERFGGIGVDQQHLQFASVPTVDQAGRVENRHTMASCQTTAGLHEARVTIRDRHGEARGHETPTPCWRERDIFGCDQVAASVSGLRVGRERQVGIETKDREFEHDRRR